MTENRMDDLQNGTANPATADERPLHEQAARTYTHDHPVDTLLEYHRDGMNAELWLSFTSEDPDMGTEEISFNGDAGESMEDLVQGLQAEISDYLDRLEQHDHQAADGIHSSDDYYGEFSHTALYAFEACLQEVEEEKEQPLAWHPLPSEKADWLYSDSDKDAQRGCIGHLRGDFGKSGNEFWTSWFDHQPKLKQDVFKQELQKLVDTLRQPKGMLSGFSAMQRHCREGTSLRGSYGFHAASPHYEYCLRCSPIRGDYHFYMYCYDKAAQRAFALDKPSVADQLKASTHPRTTAHKAHTTKDKER